MAMLLTVAELCEKLLQQGCLFLTLNPMVNYILRPIYRNGEVINDLSPSVVVLRHPERWKIARMADKILIKATYM